MNVIETNALEGITPPTKIIEREDKKYEILITVPDI